LRFKNIIGKSFTKKQLEKEHYISSECDKYYDNLLIRYPIQRGVFVNEEDIQLIFEYIFTQMELNHEKIKNPPLFLFKPQYLS